MSGHSKWSQIKHKKAITDAKKGKIFSRLVREVMIASKSGGNPDINIRLRAAMEHARAAGVPKDNIDRAIARGSGNAPDLEFKDFLYEATGPGGVAILIEGVSDNTNRSISEIKHLVSAHGGRIADSGSLLWNFQKIGILEVSEEQNSRMPKNDIELAFIETGVRDFFSTENNTWIVETEFVDRERIRKQLEQKSIVVNMSEHDYKPINTVTLNSQNAASTESLINALAEHEDVQEVYTNLQDGL